ncbi:MAG: YciI family protein [Ignavibacteria bacterium]
MKEFMFLFRNSEEALNKLTSEEKKQYYSKWGAWLKSFADKKIYVDGDRLSPTEAVTISGKGKTITDGPYIESKEIIGGYVRIKAKDIEQAVQYAEDCPLLEINGIVEIRASFEE